jgi:hypothetical protein
LRGRTHRGAEPSGFLELTSCDGRVTPQPRQARTAFVHLGLEGPGGDFVDQGLGADQRLLDARQGRRVAAAELGVGEGELRPHLVVPAVLRPRDRHRHVRFLIQVAPPEQGRDQLGADIGFEHAIAAAGRRAQGLFQPRDGCVPRAIEPVRHPEYEESDEERLRGGCFRARLQRSVGVAARGGRIAAKDVPSGSRERGCSR